MLLAIVCTPVLSALQGNSFGAALLRSVILLTFLRGVARDSGISPLKCVRFRAGFIQLNWQIRR